MKAKIISFVLRQFRGSVVAKVKRYILLLILVALAHVPYLEHVFQVLQIPPDVAAGGLWMILMDALQHLRDSYPQAQPYLDPIIEGLEEAGKPSLDDVSVKAEPLKPAQ